MADLIFQHLIQEPKIKSEQPPLLIMLHGYGSHEMDLFSFSDDINEHLLILSLRAPRTLPWGGFAWYDINFDQIGGKMNNIEQAKDSLSRLEAMLEDLPTQLNYDPDRVYLMGFSQGAIMSYALSFRHPQKFKGIMALSGYVLPELTPDKMAPTHFTELSYFISHGTQDEVLPVQWGRNATSVLEQLNARHTYREYPMGHGINPDCYADLKAYLRSEGVL